MTHKILMLDSLATWLDKDGKVGDSGRAYTVITALQQAGYQVELLRHEDREQSLDNIAAVVGHISDIWIDYKIDHPVVQQLTKLQDRLPMAFYTGSSKFTPESYSRAYAQAEPTVDIAPFGYEDDRTRKMIVPSPKILLMPYFGKSGEMADTLRREMVEHFNKYCKKEA